MTPDSAAALLDRLQQLRTDALEKLAEAAPVIDCGLQSLIANVGAVLAALKAEDNPDTADNRRAETHG